MTASGAIRIDRLLVCLRFARTRSAALALIETRALRRNRNHVLRGSEPVRIGDVLTIALGRQVRVIELVALPDRRGSPEAARSHYRELAGFSEVDEGQLVPKGQNSTGAPSPDTSEVPS
ncbi:RNA-binding S4 domain-containing protein [Porphyrobacter sp. YT40]|uniref:RNA-binding S4 domain-containing protein n=1 Tax=Porphyrobacter sp. YT40 TaxID=2547601 RepID=UPI0015E8E535|nr:RNA-binding S4 domain-containing protein [Porphyrobacter sp. YT40]